MNEPIAPSTDLELVRALRAGDEDAFAALVDRYGPQMLRLAMARTPSRAVAEEVVQEAWMGVLEGLDRFEGRSSLKTWIFRILVNRAITRGQRERRTLPFSSLPQDEAGGGPSVDPDRFLPNGVRGAGAWTVPPRRWDEIPEERLLADETLERVREAIDRLPPTQRQVITLRDVYGWSSEDVRNVLELTETNQRVLLHRARSSVRRALERYLEMAEA